MSRFSLLRHHLAPAGGGGVTPTILHNPEISGIPRALQSVSIYGGEYNPAPTHYRYNVQRIQRGDTDTIVNTTSTTLTSNNLIFTSTLADQDYGMEATVDLSFDNGQSYPLAVAADDNFSWYTEVIMEAVQSPISITRDSASGAALQFTISGKIYACQILDIKIEANDLVTRLYFGSTGIPESARSSPFTIDLSGATDPAPSPAISDFLPSGIPLDAAVWFRLRDPLFLDTVDELSSSGQCSNWVGVSPTDRAGYRMWRLTNTGASAWYRELQLLQGGVNIVKGRTIISNQAVPGSGNLIPYAIIDADSIGTDNGTFMQTGDYYIFDFSKVNVAPTQVVIGSRSGFGDITGFKIDKSNDGGATWVNSTTQAGLSGWTGEDRTYALS